MQRNLMYRKLAQINTLLLATFLFSPFAHAAFSAKWGYFSVGAVLLFLLVVFGLGGLKRLRAHFNPPQLTEYDFEFYRLINDAETHLKEIATDEEKKANWPKGHLWNRIIYLYPYIKPFMDESSAKLYRTVKKEDLALITRYYDLIYANGGRTESRKLASRTEIERYLKQLPESERKNFTLRKLIQHCFLNQKIGSPKYDRIWAEICEEYNQV